jgi:hypothetical protein
MCLLFLCAANTGCGTSAERKPEPERTTPERAAAAEKRKAEEKAAAEKKAAEDKVAAERKAALEKIAAEKKAADENAAAEKKAAQKRAAADSFVKVRVEVELRGVLASTDEAVTITVVTPFGPDEFKEVKWVLDFSDEKELRARAKSVDGKSVLVKGTAVLRGIESLAELEYRKVDQDPEEALRRGPIRRGEGPSGIRMKSVIDLEPKIAVKSLVVVTKE